MSDEIKLRAVPDTEAALFYSADYEGEEDRARGCIGHLRGDFGSGGKEFWTTWWEHSTELKTPEFQSDLNRVVNGLRKDGLLKDLCTMQKVNGSMPEAVIPGAWDNSHGFRCDSENYSYYIRAMTNPGDYNFYVYCYQRDTLEQYLESQQQEQASGSCQQNGMTLG